MEDKTFELLTKMYAEMTDMKKEMKEEFKAVKEDIKELKTDVSDMKADIAELKTDVAKIELKLENEVAPKVQALFDGYKQNSDKLERIEEEVTKQEEIIKRVK
jgi:archaellum component FlaC